MTKKTSCYSLTCPFTANSEQELAQHEQEKHEPKNHEIKANNK